MNKKTTILIILIAMVLIISGCINKILVGLEEFCKTEEKELTDWDREDTYDFWIEENFGQNFDIECNEQRYRVHCEEYKQCNERDKWENCIDLIEGYECKK